MAHDPLDPDPAAAPFDVSHARLRARVRAWVVDTISPYTDAWEDAREFPGSVYRSAGEAGLLGWKYGPADGGRGPDPLADAVVTEELARCGSGGVAAGLGAAKDLAPYYVARFGSADQRARLLRPAVAGEAVAGLAVTEPGAGSDVAAVTTRAVRDEAGGWVLTGAKTFCTNGSRADWLLVLARTSGEGGASGMSLFVVPTDLPGFSATRIATLGWRTSQTGELRFDDVRLPPGALLGEEGAGFGYVMRSFQWERLALALAACSAAAANLAAARPRLAGAWASGRFAELVAEVAGARALTYAALVGYLAGTEPLREVSAAKWLACDVDVATAQLRSAVAPDDPRADRALRDARLGPIGGGAREVMAELVARTIGLG